MLNINNTVNYEINVKQKYSWSTVFAWLYLKTIGRILPKKWNKWAENILSNKVTFQDTTMQTECIETTDKSVGADLKPEVAEKGSQSEVISKDGEVQTNKVTFQDTTMQTECVETTDKSIGADLKPEVVEKESQSVVINKDGGVQTDGVALIIEEDDEALKEQLEGINQELELERLQNASLKAQTDKICQKIKKLFILYFLNIISHGSASAVIAEIDNGALSARVKAWFWVERSNHWWSLIMTTPRRRLYNLTVPS